MWQKNYGPTSFSRLFFSVLGVLLGLCILPTLSAQSVTPPSSISGPVLQQVRQLSTMLVTRLEERKNQEAKLKQELQTAYKNQTASLMELRATLSLLDESKQSLTAIQKAADEAKKQTDKEIAGIKNSVKIWQFVGLGGVAVGVSGIIFAIIKGIVK